MKATARTAANPLPQVPPHLQISASFDALDNYLHAMQQDLEAAQTVMRVLSDTNHPRGNAVGHVALTFLDVWVDRVHKMRDAAELVNRGLEELPGSAGA